MPSACVGDRKPPHIGFADSTTGQAQEAMTPASTPVLRYLSAAAVSVCGIVGAGCGPTSGLNASAPAGSTPDVACDGHQGANQSVPQVYRSRYSDTVVAPLQRILAVYHSAIESNRTQQIADAAGALSSQIREDIDTFGRQSAFGCYQPEPLAQLRSATDAFVPVLFGLVDRQLHGSIQPRYHPMDPGTPLKGPTTQLVIQPP